MNATTVFASVPAISDQKPEGSFSMLAYEELAKIRMYEAQRSAAEQRMARRLLVCRRWRRIAAWAVARADRVASTMAS